MIDFKVIYKSIIGPDDTCHGNYTDQVDITEFVEPEVVAGRGGALEVVAVEASVAGLHGAGQATQNPPVHVQLSTTQLKTKTNNTTLMLLVDNLANRK